MKLDRRNFLRNGALAVAGMAISNPLLAGAQRIVKKSSGPAEVRAGENVLVVVNLFGGNDGLNTMVPIQPAQYNTYLQLRPTLAHNLDTLLSLNGEPDFGLNPHMTGFQSLFNNGRLAIVNGVSVPDSAVGLFDHEAGQFEFQTCDIIRNLAGGPSTGWLGRYLDQVPDPEPGQVSPGIDMGGGGLMLSGSVREPVAISTISNFQLQVSYDEAARRSAYDSAMNIPHNEGGIGEQSRQYRLQALAQSEIIRAATSGYVPSVVYPESFLGIQLRECAKLIFGDVGARVLAVGIGGFDTHSGQNIGNPGDPGFHDGLLKNVSDAVNAFYTDLVNQGLSSRVLILTISEFGRRAYENNDQGTDHGFASVCFAAGDMVNGGIYGLYPDLNNLVLDGNLGMTNDFRSVYATVLGNYLNVDPQPILDPNDYYPDFSMLGFV